jgi:hypothetical protein
MALLLVSIEHDLGVQTPVVYPIASPAIALVVLLAVTAIVIRVPLRRGDPDQAWIGPPLSVGDDLSGQQPS